MKTIPGTNLKSNAPSAFDEFAAMQEARKAKKAAQSTVEKAQETAKDATVKAKAEKPAKVKVEKVAKDPKVNEKKVVAQTIFNANKELGNGEIAKLIADNLEITYANAYYYVTRVFRK
jgi:hypothetical protein